MVFPRITAATKKESGYKDISTEKFHKKDDSIKRRKVNKN